MCKECDAEIELDEPQQCYYTGRGNCGDCDMNCFHPILCDDCKAETVQLPSRRERRRQAIADMFETRAYTAERKKSRHLRNGGRFI